MNTETSTTDNTSNQDSSVLNDKLIKLDEAATAENKSNSATGASDINHKITALDTDLAQLRIELGAINSSVEEGLDRLSDSDTDLTAKVSETYKRLGEIDNAYKALMSISGRIDNDIQKLNGDVSTVAEQSASGIKNLEKSTIEQSNDFAQKNQQVVTRVNQLVETSKLTSEMLNQKIQATTENILTVEKNIVAEINQLTDSTKDKTESIEQNLEQSKAQILKLQSVDEAIIKRATTLEISSAELTVKNQTLEASTDQLFASAELLSTELDVLKTQTRELEELTAKQGGLIGKLQSSTADLGDKLALLAQRESRHFSIFSLGFLLLLIAVVVIYYSQQGQFDATDIRHQAQTEKVDNQIANIQQVQVSNNALTEEAIVALETKVENLNANLKEELEADIAAVEKKLVTVNDQVQSVEGRFNNDSPFSQVGDDNVIHGPQWLLGQSADNYALQLAYVDDKARLYEIAERYNHHLTEKLSYFEVVSGDKTKFVLLSGNYDSASLAQKSLNDLPGYIDMRKPVIRELKTVQEYLLKNQ